jgi:hypothetical protein
VVAGSNPVSPTQPDSVLPQVKGHNGEPRQTPMGIHRGMYRNRYSFLAPSRSSAEKVARASLTSSSAAPGHTTAEVV